MAYSHIALKNSHYLILAWGDHKVNAGFPYRRMQKEEHEARNYESQEKNY